MLQRIHTRARAGARVRVRVRIRVRARARARARKCAPSTKGFKTLGLPPKTQIAEEFFNLLTVP